MDTFFCVQCTCWRKGTPWGGAIEEVLGKLRNLMNMLICCSGVQDIKQHSRPFWLAHTSVLLQILAFWSLWQVDVDLGKLRLRPRIQRAVHWDDTRFQQTLQAIQRWRQACHRLSLLDRVGFFKWVSWCCFGVVWCWGCSDHSGSRSFASFWIPRQFFVAVFFLCGWFCCASLKVQWESNVLHRFALFSNRLMVKQHETTVVCCYKMFHVVSPSSFDQVRLTWTP